MGLRRGTPSYATGISRALVHRWNCKQNKGAGAPCPHLSISVSLKCLTEAPTVRIQGDIISAAHHHTEAFNSFHVAPS